MGTTDDTNYNNLIASIDPLRNQYLIPSYKVIIANPTVFHESESNPPDPESPKGRRQVGMSNNGKPNTGSSAPVPVWVFSLDGKDVKGPFDVEEEKLLYVEIDDRHWGVLANPSEEVSVSVWVE